MVKFTHPEIFYLFPLFIIVLFIYVVKGERNKKNIERLGTNKIIYFLLNRVFFSRVYLRSRLMIIAIFCI